MFTLFQASKYFMRFCRFFIMNKKIVSMVGPVTHRYTELPVSVKDKEEYNFCPSNSPQ